MPRNPFRVSVSDLAREHGRRRSVEIEAPVDWGLQFSRLDRSLPLRASLTLEGVSGGIHIRGPVEATVHHVCNRCLREWSEEIGVELNEVLSPDPEADYRIRGDQIDLEAPLRDALLLSLPLLPLCRPDCRGLCAVCGADLNSDPCSGHDEEPGSPFVALRHLLEP